MTSEARVHALRLTLPDPPVPLGAYVPAVEAGRLLFVSGMLPLREGSPGMQRTSRQETIGRGGS